MNSEVKIRKEVNEFSVSMSALKQELMKTKKKAEQAEKLKTAFLNNISHEIRTPLNGILGFLDFFNDDLAEGDRNQFITIMRESGERLLTTINHIVVMSKLESGNMDLNQSVFNLNDALDEFNDKIKHKYAVPNIAYNFEFETNEEQTWVETDRLKMCEILENLIDNAFKFTREGYVKLTVIRNKNTLTFEVEDSGIGISNEDLQIIFEPFRQANCQLNRKYEGNGLGLAISKRLVQLMGGELTFESPEHKGARFICTFPSVVDSHIKKGAKKAFFVL